MSSQFPSNNPTGYFGITPTTPGQNWYKRRDPLSSDYKNYCIGDRWINEDLLSIWALVGKTASGGTWVPLGGGNVAVNGLLLDDANTAYPNAGIITLTGDSAQGISTSLPIANTAEITIANAAAAQKGVVQSSSVVHGVLIGGATQELIKSTTAGTSGQILQSKGAATDPAWTTATYPATTTSGQVLLSTATNQIDSSPSITASSTGIISTPYQSGASAYLSVDVANQTGNGDDAIVVFNAEDYDIQGEYDFATGIFTAKNAGIYLVMCNVLLDNIGAANTSGELRIRKNAFTYWKSQFNPTASKDVGSQLTINGSVTINCAVGDELKVIVNIYNDTKTVGFKAGASGASTTFQIAKIA